MRHILTIDKIPLNKYGVWIDGSKVYNSASPDVSKVSVPGRNGDLLYSNNRFSNIDIAYNALFYREFKERFDDFKAFLLSSVGYRRIEDSHLPGRYRIGRIKSGINPSSIIWHADAGLFTMTFDCKPQVFLTEGEQEIELLTSGKIMNPTMFNAKPLVRLVSATGTFSINGESIVILAHTGIPYIDIDCEAQEAYCGDINCNQYISVANDTFPSLKPGVNLITFDSGITNVKITPRWWTI